MRCRACRVAGPKRRYVARAPPSTPTPKATTTSHATATNSALLPFISSVTMTADDDDAPEEQPENFVIFFVPSPLPFLSAVLVSFVYRNGVSCARLILTHTSNMKKKKKEQKKGRGEAWMKEKEERREKNANGNVVVGSRSIVIGRQNKTETRGHLFPTLELSPTIIVAKDREDNLDKGDGDGLDTKKMKRWRNGNGNRNRGKKERKEAGTSEKGQRPEEITTKRKDQSKQRGKDEKKTATRTKH